MSLAGDNVSQEHGAHCTGQQKRHDSSVMGSKVGKKMRGRANFEEKLFLEVGVHG